MEKFNQLVQFVQSLEGDFQKFYVKEEIEKSVQRAKIDFSKSLSAYF